MTRPASRRSRFPTEISPANPKAMVGHPHARFADPAIGELLSRGKLSQTCPCGVTEAAGSYCTRCLRPMGEADWHPIKRSESQKAAALTNARRLGGDRTNAEAQAVA
jgi:hypothetical protein